MAVSRLLANSHLLQMQNLSPSPHTTLPFKLSRLSPIIYLFRFSLVPLRLQWQRLLLNHIPSSISTPNLLIPTDFPEFDDNDSKLLKWRRFSSKELGISTFMIPKPTRKVLNGLKKRGYEVYRVGGCVRDLILN